MKEAFEEVMGDLKSWMASAQWALEKNDRIQMEHLMKEANGQELPGGREVSVTYCTPLGNEAKALHNKMWHEVYGEK